MSNTYNGMLVIFLFLEVNCSIGLSKGPKAQKEMNKSAALYVKMLWRENGGHAIMQRDLYPPEDLVMLDWIFIYSDCLNWSVSCLFHVDW